MTKSKSVTFHPLLGIVFIIAGALIVVLAFFNYLQDGRISSTIVVGLLGISGGLLLYSQAKKLKAKDESEKNE
jgi:uncharacterized membrane protein HdeD (DUF308 family)